MDKKIHIVHILYSFGTGGMEKGIATLISHASANFKHTVICLKNSGQSQSLLPEDTKVIEMNKRDGNSLMFIVRLAIVIKALRPDIVHTRNWGGLDGVFAAKLAGIRNIVHGEHGWSVDDPYGLRFKRVIIRKFANLMISRYTCVSRQIKEWLSKNIRVNRQIMHIMNGVDCLLYSPRNGKLLKKNLGISEKVIIFGIVARLDPIKNHAMLIRVFKRFSLKYPETCLLVVGDGPIRKELELAANSEKIIFLGNRSDVKDILNIMDMFVLPSFNEGISNTILEAMATGLPVAASNRGGNTELVKNHQNGILFNPENDRELEEILENYMQNTELLKFYGIRGKKMAEQLFTTQKMVSGYESVWSAVAGK